MKLGELFMGFYELEEGDGIVRTFWGSLLGERCRVCGGDGEKRREGHGGFFVGGWIM